MKYTLIAITIIFTIFMASCSFHEEYPKDWTSITTLSNGECPNITGKYMNDGEDPNSDYKPSLSWGLFGDVAPWKDASHVSFKQEGSNKVDITIWKNNNNIFFKSLDRKSNSFICDKGLLKIKIKEYINRDGVLGSEWHTYGLSKSDNYLIVKNESGGAGLFFLVPVVGSGTDWYRFKEVED